MSDELEAHAAVRALAEPVRDLGARFMFHPATIEAGAQAGYADPVSLYVAGRCGVLGDVDADVVAAAVGFFEPSSLRTRWEAGTVVEGARAASRRYAGCCAQWGTDELRGLDGLGRLADLAERLVDAADVVAKPLFAGWRAEPRPEDAAGRVALALQVMREWRGGVHIIAIASAGITPLEAVTASSGERFARFFGWHGDLPDTTHLAERRQAAEDLTDALMVPAMEQALAPGERAELVRLVLAVQEHLRPA